MLGFVFASFTVLFGIGTMEVRRFERVAANEIRSRLQGESPVVQIQTKLNGVIDGPLLGDLKTVTIRARDFSTEGLPLFTEPDRGTKGRVRLLRIELANFVLAGLRVESLVAEIPDCRYDYGLAARRRQIRLSRSGVGKGQVRILQADLGAYILRKFKEIKRVEVRTERDKVWVKGYGEFLLLASDFEVVARLESPDGVSLSLADARVWFDGRPADELAARAVLRTLNPVVHLDEDLKLHGAIRVQGVRLQDGALEAWGETRIPEAPVAKG